MMTESCSVIAVPTMLFPAVVVDFARGIGFVKAPPAKVPFAHRALHVQAPPRFVNLRFAFGTVFRLQVRRVFASLQIPCSLRALLCLYAFLLRSITAERGGVPLCLAASA